MPKLLTMLLLFGAVIVAQSPPALTLSSERVDAIVADPHVGTGLKMHAGHSHFNGTGSSGFDLAIFSPSAWIKSNQVAASKEQRPFAVTDDMRRDIWRVHALPDMPTKITEPCGSVAHTVISDRSNSGGQAGGVVIQPTVEKPFDVSASTAMGATKSCQGLDAEYPSAPILELLHRTASRVP